MTSRLFAVSLLAVGLATSASAQVTYRHGDVDGGSSDSRLGTPYGSDDDMSYATHPSFQIIETPYGPQTRVIYRCAYPNGWNATDFIRDINGTPTGIGHTCPDPVPVQRRARARY